MQTTDASNFFRTETELAKDQARQEKAQRTKSLGSPLELPGKILGLKVRGPDAWTAESGHVVRRLSLESETTLQLYKGHTGPVTCLAFREPDVLFTGSWDQVSPACLCTTDQLNLNRQTIRTWRMADKSLLSSTLAHSDFVKTLLVIPSLSILVSGSSDKIVRFWDLSSDLTQPLMQLGSISAHTRPVEALAFEPKNDASCLLYTADTMGVMKVWELDREFGASANCRGVLKAELHSHRTGVNDLWVGKGFVFSASNDESVIIQPSPLSTPTVKNPSKTHIVNVPSMAKSILPLALTILSEPYLITACGDVIRVYSYDTATSDDAPELLGEIDAHWHDVTALGLWIRVVETQGKKNTETWILSASLDATLRRWQLEDIINPKAAEPTEPPLKVRHPPTFTEEEERELEELMGDD
ncbi:WD40 repeat-like protein [Ramaria rubella]|nr:WD40 repeat-like protein [Ramaria rubella]